MMSKKLHSARRGEERPHLTAARMKDNTDQTYLKYISNVSNTRKSPGKFSILGKFLQFIILKTQHIFDFVNSTNNPCYNQHIITLNIINLNQLAKDAYGTQPVFIQHISSSHTKICQHYQYFIKCKICIKDLLIPELRYMLHKV